MTTMLSSRTIGQATALATFAVALGIVAVVALRPAGDEAIADNPHGNGPMSQVVGDVDSMIARLEARLASTPNDVEGWRMLGWSRLQTGSATEAIAAYDRALAIAPGDAPTWAALGEAHMAAGDNEDARSAFSRALKLDPAEPAARYSMALLKEQAGDTRGAVEDWLAMLDSAPPGAEWAPEVQQKVSSSAAAIGMDISGRLPPISSASGAAAISVGAYELPSALPSDGQEEMIAGMVERLAARLEKDPRDAEGWIQLMRSRMVLGQAASAAEALSAGVAAFSDHPPTQAKLREAAASLGVGG